MKSYFLNTKEQIIRSVFLFRGPGLLSNQTQVKLSWQLARTQLLCWSLMRVRAVSQVSAPIAVSGGKA